MDRDGEMTRGLRTDLFSNVTSEQALELLRAGNRRFVSGKTVLPEDAQARQLLAKFGQRPFACILGCADSRVPPERVFDVGIGQLFVVRGAGNTADDTAIGSIEYAASHLHVPLVVVMGHSGCGMIAAAISGGGSSPFLNAIIERIQPALDKTRRAADSERARHCEDENILLAVEKLDGSGILSELKARGRLKIIGAKYELSTGVVEFRV